MRVPRFVMTLRLNGCEWLIPLDTAKDAKLFLTAADKSGYVSVEFLDLLDDSETDLINFETTTIDKVIEYIDRIEPMFQTLLIKADRYNDLIDGLKQR